MSGSKNSARAHWLTRDLIAFPELLNGPKLEAGDISIDLVSVSGGLPGNVVTRLPHLRSFHALRIPQDMLKAVPKLLKGPLTIAGTGVQIARVLDDLYRYDGPLGLTLNGRIPTLRLWAPTARSVTFLLGDVRLPMTLDEATGVWSITGTADWLGQFYRYEVEVFVRTTGCVEHNVVTDPYSISLSTNSRSSQIVDLDDSNLKPSGWDALIKPPIEAEDMVVYELHLRDFSMSDPAVPPEHRGTYLAFTHRDSFGMNHLRKLAEAGLTHVQLLPVSDFATVNDIRREHAVPRDLEHFPRDSTEPQASIKRINAIDGFNWGYDPLHYSVPEGSYSTNPEGPTRIVEFRSMIKALAETGLRVVMDVVYNHTHAAGQDELSVLDRIVPDYYHRLSLDGRVEKSSCCPNTATEHAMMEKLMIDSVMTWVQAYKIDGFRFDLMGHHLKSNMVKLRALVDPSIQIYGEGWDFGEVANNARGLNATQTNLAGTGIGTFNDRFRDAIRGGGPFHGLQEQGFATGCQDPTRLSQLGAAIRGGLAGSLKSKGGYTEKPRESINYASAHDNETLFDAIQLKAPRNTSMPDRVRMNNFAVSLVMLAQGIPFFHAGDEILRSKSFDRNSFNSGDWFNRLDFTMQSHNFGVGLPPAAENEKHWQVMRPLLSDPSLRPSRNDMQRAFDHFLEMLRIRKNNKWFRLRDAESVQRFIHFAQTEPGLVVMLLGDIKKEFVITIFNAWPREKSFQASELRGTELTFEGPTSESTFDSATATFSVAGRTVAVFSKRA